MAGPEAWMPVYWADLWNDTRDLNAVEQCAYYNLLGSMWVEGGSLPNDNDRLQRMSRVTEKEWRAVSVTVIAYFDCGDDGRLYQKRLTAEYAKALKAYNGRRDHINNVNSRRKQSPPTDTVNTDSHTAHNSHTPNGVDNHPSDDLAKRPRALKGNRLANDWKPSEQTRWYGASVNLTDAECAAEIQQFCEYFWSPDATKPVKKDWDGACKRWLSRAAPGIIARRQRSQNHAGGRQSVAAAKRAILAEAGIQQEHFGPSGDEIRTEGCDGAGSDFASPEDSGPLIDADEWQRVPGPSSGNEGDDTPVTGLNGRPANHFEGVSEALHGVSGGCGPACAEDAA